MKMTPKDIEAALSLPAFSVLISDGEVRADGAVICPECSLWALRCMIRRRGLDAAIDAGIAALAPNQQTAAWAQWNYAGDKLSRSDVLVKQIRAWIGYNERQMDALFAAAVLSLMPTINFSGMLTPVSSLSAGGRLMGYGFPSAHFQKISIGAFTKALGFGELWIHYLALAGFTVGFLLLALVLLKTQEI